MDHNYPRLRLLQESFPWLASLTTHLACNITNVRLGELGSQLLLSAEEVQHLSVSQKRLLENSGQLKRALSQVENVISVSTIDMSKASDHSQRRRDSLPKTFNVLVPNTPD